MIDESNSLSPPLIRIKKTTQGLRPGLFFGETEGIDIV